MHESTIYFDQLDTDKVILLQLTPDLLNKKLFIKSSSASSSVLCTESTTYQLKDVQQSNSLLFLSSSETFKEERTLKVKGQAASWLETTVISRPNINLAQVPVYNGESHISGIDRDIIFSSLPASNQEIEIALRAAMCIEIDSGYVRLDSGYVLRLIHILINSILAAGLSLQNISEQEYRQAIADEEENVAVLLFLLKRFSSNESEPHSLNHKEIAKYAGLHTLLTTVNRAPSTIDTFHARWKQNTPVQLGYESDLTLLRGLYICPVATQIRYFSTTDLSSDPKIRIGQLLDTKERWSEIDIHPFLEDICTDSKAVNSTIMKYAKKVKIGKTVFVERRGK